MIDDFSKIPYQTNFQRGKEPGQIKGELGGK